MDINIIPKSKNILVMDKIIKVCIYLLVFLIPLWFLPITINVLDFNKQALMVFLIVIALILWLAKLLSQEEFIWKKSMLNWAILAFLVVGILATIFSLRPYSSLMGFASHLSSSLINILAFIALYVLILNNFKGAKEIFKLVFTFLLSSAVVSVFGFLQILGTFILPWNFAKLTSFNTIGTMNSLGIFSVISLIVATVLLITTKKSGIKVFLGLLALLNLLILFCLNFWILWIVLGVGMVVILTFGSARIHQEGTKIGWMIILPMILLVFSLFFILLKPVLPLNLNLPMELSLSHKGGLGVIKELVKEKPVFGTGPETFFFNYSKYKPAGINQTAFWNIRFTNPPAEIFSVVSDTGILGLLAFLGMIGIFSYLTIKKMLVDKISKINNINIALFSAWLALAVSWILYPQNLTLMFLFWLFMALLAMDFSVDEKKISFKTSSKIALIISFAFVVIILGAVSLFYLEGTRFFAEVKYKQGLDSIQLQDKLEEGINKVIRATTLNSYEDRIFRNLSQLLLMKATRDLNQGVESQEERLNKARIDASNAINSAIRATNLNPYDVANWLNRGDIYKRTIGFIGGSEKWAESSYKQALMLESLNPFIYTEMGRVYTLVADFLTSKATEDESARKQRGTLLNGALQLYNKAIEIKSDYSPAHFEIALTYNRQGRIKEAIAKMENNKDYSPKDTGIAFQLAVLYYKSSQFNKAKSEFQRTVSLDPKFSNARYFLGLLFDRDGNKEMAIKEFEVIVELNPDNQNVKQILANLKAGKPALGSSELGPPEQPEEVPIEKPIEED